MKLLTMNELYDIAMILLLTMAIMLVMFLIGVFFHAIGNYIDANTLHELYKYFAMNLRW